MKPSVGSNCVFRVFPGERERVAPLSPPVPRGDVGEQSAPRPRRRKQSHQENSLPRRKRISPPEQLRESARGSQPSRSRHPRGCRGAERPMLVSSETASTKEQPASSGTKASPEQPRESARGSQPSRTPSGVRKRSASCPCRRKQRSQMDNLHRREPKPRQNSPGRAREGRSPLAPRRE